MWFKEITGEIVMKLIYISIMLIMLIPISMVEGRDIIVSQGENIQSAITNASSGDTIWVKSGNYHENLNIDKNISLYGWNTGRGDPVIDAGMKGNAITLQAGSDWTEIQGFQVKNAANAGIEVDSNNDYIGFISAINNNYGILVKSSSASKRYNDASVDVSIEDNTFYNNNYGIFLDSCDNYVIQLNTASVNNYGIYINSSHDNQILGNDLVDNRIYDSYDTDNTGSNNWDGNRFTNHNSPHKIPGGSSVDENPVSKTPTVPEIAGKRHRAPRK